MTWAVAGSSDDIVISLTNSGNVRFSGNSCSHEVYIAEDYVDEYYDDTADFLRRMMSVKADWAIVSTEAVPEELLYRRDELVEKIASNSGVSTGRISCFDGDNLCISFTIALRPKAFARIQELFSKLVAGSSTVRYTISMDAFINFARPGAVADITTLQEFKTGRPLYFHNVSIYVTRSGLTERT